ncbi:monovalent cation:H+ antiporter, CPA1 (nhx1) [Lithohypha guttulata]|uniref:Sodium/hydrogen exchanger n=1 Tax=Lithohypha guttulata TaxID=1690604 RepID=A0AAN7Y935_9EURO|nr:monovalent cation:H+ antiporter, CPA1 (nhx1) [Lithohypha guttulata]
MSQFYAGAFEILRRAVDDDGDSDDPADAGDKEFFTSWALFIVIMLLISALFTSYLLQQKKIQAVHETVVSIFAGMVVGLIIRVSPGRSIQDSVSFDYQFFFNLLLPPIILASGYELHQGNFFRNIGTILTFAFFGTFISAVSLAIILWLWTRIPLDGLSITFVEALSVGATLSATDPVTILAIFNLYKVEPKLYTVIFGESILNDAIAIVLFETAQRYKEGAAAGNLTILSLFEAVGFFLLVFSISVLIGICIGVGTAIILKYTLVRRYPKLEACIVLLIAYASYFFSNGVRMSGIVSLLFCGITLKHYAYYNMSRRTQLTTKFIFQITAQLSENFIFIYLGLTLFTETDLVYKPLFILVTVVGICAARWLSVFPLSKVINYIIRVRARRRGVEVAEELPWRYQAMLFWAGLRGAVGVALAAGLSGENGAALRATVLVVVVLTVIIFGGTTARMLEILGIKTGVIEEIDSDDEFDIETTNQGTYYKRGGQAFGHTPKGSANIGLDYFGETDNKPANGHTRPSRPRQQDRGYSSSNRHSPSSRERAKMARKNSQKLQRDRDDLEQRNLLSGPLIRSTTGSDDEDDYDPGADLDLPPAAPRRQQQPSPLYSSRTNQSHSNLAVSAPEIMVNDEDITAQSSPASNMNRLVAPIHQSVPTSSAAGIGGGVSGIKDLLRGAARGDVDSVAWLRQLDENFIKPTLLLDQGQGQAHGHGHGHKGGGGSPV